MMYNLLRRSTMASAYSFSRIIPAFYRSLHVKTLSVHNTP